MRDFHQSALAWLVALSVVGYPLLAAALALVAPDAGSAPSIAFRMSVAVLAIVVFLSAERRWTGEDRLLLLLFGAFWLMYIARIFHEATTGGHMLGLGLFSYLTYTVTFSILPAVGALGAHWSFSALERAAFLTVLLGTIALVLGGAALLLSDSYSLYSRAGFDKLNPISLGRLGAAVIVLTLVHRRLSASSASIPMRVPIIMLGTAVLALASSKGPLFSLALTLLIWGVATARHAVRILLVLLALPLIVFVGLPYFGIEFLDLPVVARVEKFFSDPLADKSTILRLLAYHSAWMQFLSSPLIGNALVDNVTRYYPHNALLEAAMAMGVTGLVPLVIMFWLAARNSLYAFRHPTPSAWLHAVALLSIINAMFSGGLYAAEWFIFVVAAIRLRDFDEAAASAAQMKRSAAGAAFA